MFVNNFLINSERHLKLFDSYSVRLSRSLKSVRASVKKYNA